MSVADFLDEYFEDPSVKGALAYGGVIGSWAGPSSPGTAYVLLHHRMGGGEGASGGWGFVRGGMGALSEAIAGSARWAGAEIRTEAEVEEAGLDVSEHGMWGYPEFYIPVPGGYGTDSPSHLTGAMTARAATAVTPAPHVPPAAVEGA